MIRVMIRVGSGLLGSGLWLGSVIEFELGSVLGLELGLGLGIGLGLGLGVVRYQN